MCRKYYYYCNRLQLSYLSWKTRFCVTVGGANLLRLVRDEPWTGLTVEEGVDQDGLIICCPVLPSAGVYG